MEPKICPFCKRRKIPEKPANRKTCGHPECQRKRKNLYSHGHSDKYPPRPRLSMRERVDRAQWEIPLVNAKIEKLTKYYEEMEAGLIANGIDPHLDSEKDITSLM